MLLLPLCLRNGVALSVTDQAHGVVLSPSVLWRVLLKCTARARDTAAAITTAVRDYIGDMTESVLAGEQQFGLFEGLPVEKIASGDFFHAFFDMSVL